MSERAGRARERIVDVIADETRELDDWDAKFVFDEIAAYCLIRSDEVANEIRHTYPKAAP